MTSVLLELPFELFRVAREVVETVSLADHVHQVASNLSGGEQARLSLATALLGEPEVLVLDEPTGGLVTVRAATSGPTFADWPNRR